MARNGIDVAPATLCGKQRAATGEELGKLVSGSEVTVNLRVRQEEEGVVSRELVTRRFTGVVDLTLSPGRIIHRHRAA